MTQSAATFGRYRPGTPTEAFDTHPPVVLSDLDTFAAVHLQPSHPSLRTSTVSLRLNESEMGRLRARAEESGISLSAYMRSCILEVEHLRSQVKAALVEMRACSAHSDAPPAIVHEPAAKPAEPASSNGTAWSRFLARSAVFLFGPWFAWRTRT